MGQSQKHFFFVICYIAGGLCPNFSLLASKLWKKIGEKGIKWPLLYIYTRKTPGISRVLTAFPGISRVFPRFRMLSWGFSCYPGIFPAIPGLLRFFPPGISQKFQLCQVVFYFHKINEGSFHPKEFKHDPLCYSFEKKSIFLRAHSSARGREKLPPLAHGPISEFFLSLLGNH